MKDFDYKNPGQGGGNATQMAIDEARRKENNRQQNSRDNRDNNTQQDRNRNNGGSGNQQVQREPIGVKRDGNGNLRSSEGHKIDKVYNDGSYLENRGNHSVRKDANGRLLDKRTVDKNGIEKLTAYNKYGQPSQTTFKDRDGSRVTVSGAATIRERVVQGSDGRYQTVRNVQRASGHSYTETRTTRSNGYSRTYIYNNTTIERHYHYVTPSYYSSWRYGVYRPVTLFDVAVYSAFDYDYHYSRVWAPRPYWATPVVYTWSWHRDPWYTHDVYGYGYYYRPYVRYTHPAYWLTDYIISNSLSASYASAQARRAELERERAELANAQAQATLAQAQATLAQANAAQQAALNMQNSQITEEMKEQINKQVAMAIQAHKEKTSLTVEQIARNPKLREEYIFVVSDELETQLANDAELTCPVNDGDLLKIVQAPDTADAQPIVTVEVVNSKKGSCRPGVRFNIAVQTLQEFQNDFTERVEEGIMKMKADPSLPQIR